MSIHLPLRRVVVKLRLDLKVVVVVVVVGGGGWVGEREKKCLIAAKPTGVDCPGWYGTQDSAIRLLESTARSCKEEKKRQ